MVSIRRCYWVLRLDSRGMIGVGKAGILRLVTLGYGRVIPPRVNRVLPRRLRVLAKYGLNAVSGGPSAPRGPVEYLHTHEHGRHKIKASVRARLARLPECQTSIAAYQQARDQRDPSALKIAVYVTITNNYDSIKLPESFNPGLDYVLFSDRPVADTGVYEVRPITYHNDDPTRTARFVKTHPHVLLGDYDVAVWVDSNIMLLDDIFPLVQKFLVSGKLVASNPHPCRNTLYEEARICRRFKTDDGDLIKNQVKTYRRLQFAHNDLVENNVMMFDLRDERTGRFWTRGGPRWSAAPSAINSASITAWRPWAWIGTGLPTARPRYSTTPASP